MSINKKLNELKENKTFKLPPVSNGPSESKLIIDGKEVINLSSNNYLGFANNELIKEGAIEAINKYGVGSGAVRTIVGNMTIHELLDKRLADFKVEEAALVFQSGYMANLGAIEAITDANDLILSDELNHASIIDGVRLSRADKMIYKHSDMKDLKEKLEKNRSNYNNCLIITDGVFSMDGDIAKLPEIVALKDEYNCMLYVDDAHGSGVLGRQGRGTVDHFNLNGKVEFIMGTLSKAFGVIGGYIACSKDAREYLLNRGRPQLFSTSLMPAAAGALLKAIDLLESSDEYTNKLWDNANYFKELLLNYGFNIKKSETPITPVMIGDEAKAISFSKELLKNGVLVSAIVFPTVPKGTARLRFMPTALHSKDELKKAAKIIFETGKEMNII